MTPTTRRPVDLEGLALAQLPSRQARTSEWVPDIRPACGACGSTRAPAFRVVYGPNQWVALCRSYAGCADRQRRGHRGAWADP